MSSNAARERVLSGLPVRTLHVAGTSTSLIELGAGDPLLLLHGGIECGGVMWAPVVRELAESYRVIVPDVPGLGESTPLAKLDAESLGRWLVELCAATDCSEPVLVAHSLVGSLVARAVSQGVAPTIHQLVVYAAPAVGPYRMPIKLRYLAIRFAVRPTPANAERFERFALLDRDAARARDPEWYDAWAAYTQERAMTRHVKRTMRELVSRGCKPMTDAELAAVTVPTALLWGRRDRMAPLAVAESASDTRGWPLHVIEHTAHAPHVEEPGRFTQVLQQLIK